MKRPGRPRSLNTLVSKRADQLGLTQAALAKKAQLSLSYVAAIERGLHPPAAVKKRLAEALDTTAEELWPELDWSEDASESLSHVPPHLG